MVSEDWWECPEVALKGARSAARRVHQQSRGLLEYDDLVAIGYEWIIRHKAKVAEWSDKETHPSGWKAMGKSMLRAMSREVAKERARRSGGTTGDAFYYTPAIVNDVLPDIWALDDRLPSRQAPSDQIRGRAAPSEGGNREAVLADVAAAVARLHTDERALLQARFYAHLTIAEVAKVHGISEDTVERKLRNITRTVIDYLGGETPWQTRRPRSTSHALAVTRTAWDGEGQ